MTPAGRAARSVRQHFAMPTDLPPNWRCRVCGRGGPSDDAAPCEGLCGSWMHWRCYWPGVLTPAERTAFAAAEIADEQSEHALEGPTIVLWFKDRRFEIPTRTFSAVEDFLEHQIVLCPGCRS